MVDADSLKQQNVIGRKPIKGISFIICAGNLERAKNCRLSIERSLGNRAPYEFIVVDNRRQQHDIFSAYSQGAGRAKQEVLGFVHDDVEFLSNSYWFDELEKLIDQSDTGVVGVAGSLDLTESGRWWDRANRLSGCAVHTDGRSEWMTAFGPFGRVAIVDGVVMFMRRQVFNDIGGFHGPPLKGFHFYDIDLSARAHWANRKNFTIDLIVKHLSIGEAGPEWEENRRLWVQAHRDLLPIRLG